MILRLYQKIRIEVINSIIDDNIEINKIFDKFYITDISKIKK